MRTLTLIVKIFVFYSLSEYQVDSSTGPKDYYGLISNVRKYFGTSCVFLVHSRQESLTELGRIEKLMRQFSHEDVLVSSVEFRRLNETMLIYAKRIVRALIVVNLREHKVVAKFSNLTNYFDMSASYWLLIFDENIYLETRFPQTGENMFHLRFNTQMLVVRSGHESIQEWFWLDNRVKMSDLAVWDFGTGFTLKTNVSLYGRRSNLENTEIEVTAIHNPPMITLSNNNNIGGWVGSILRELRGVANFKISYVKPTEIAYGSWNAKEKRWTGMIQMLVTKKATIAAAEFTMTTERMECIDFTIPLISTRCRLYIRKPEGGINWSAYWKALSPGIWIVSWILILSTTLLLTMIVAVRRSETTINLLSQYLLLVFGIYCQQGLPDFPTDLPSQIAIFSVFLSALICSAAYSGALTSFLTVTDTYLPFTNLDEFVSDTTYNLIVYQDSAEYDIFASATEPIMAKMWLKMSPRDVLPVTLEDAFRQICETKAAFYIPATLHEAVGVPIPCKVVGIDTERSMSMAIALSKGNPYNGLINYHIQKFRDYGVLNLIQQQFTMRYDPSKSRLTEATIWGVIPIFVILVGGMAFAVLILLFEIMYHQEQSQVAAIHGRVNEKIDSRGNSRSEQIRKNIKVRYRRKYYPKPSSNFYH